VSRLIASVELPSGQRFELRQGDLTEEPVDAVVNAANPRLQHGGGVAGALARKGGPIVQRDSDRWLTDNGPIDHAHPAITSAGDLPCRLLIHAVGPVWGEGQEAQKLAAAVRTALETADRLGAASLALPAISTGIYGFPPDQAAPIMLAQVETSLASLSESHLRLVRLVLLEGNVLRSFQACWQKRWPLEGAVA
jgi:O-acetyl-ADP-ribose deacetylase (regulator of RNase III)